jgi:hypothetical protein
MEINCRGWTWLSLVLTNRNAHIWRRSEELCSYPANLQWGTCISVGRNLLKGWWVAGTGQLAGDFWFQLLKSADVFGDSGKIVISTNARVVAKLTWSRNWSCHNIAPHRFCELSTSLLSVRSVTSRKVAGSRPMRSMIFFNLRNPSSRTRPWRLLSI